MINNENENDNKDDNVLNIAEEIDGVIETLFANEDITKLDSDKNLVLDINDNVLFNISEEIPKYITVELLNTHQIDTSYLIPMHIEIIQYIKDILTNNLTIDNADDDDDDDNDESSISSISFEEIININQVLKPKSVSILRDVLIGNSCAENFPVPARVWTRFNSQYYPYHRYSKDRRDMRRKAEILKYTNNKINVSKKQQYAMLAKGYLRKKKSWSTQTPTYTNFNARGLQVVGPKGPKTPDGTILICSGGKTNCASTTTNDVPGRPMQLCYEKKVPLTNYKVKRTYLAGVGKWPQTSWEPGDKGFPRGKAGGR